jgi:hypothetical protein
MNAGPTPSKKYAPRGLAVILFTAVLLPILVFLIWFVSNRWSNASAIRRLEAKARKNGEPLTYTELTATYPPIPDSQNGAALLMDEWEKDDPISWKSIRDGAMPMPDGGSLESHLDPNLPYLGSVLVKIERTNDINPVSLKAADVYIREQRQHLDKVQTALHSPRFWFPSVTSKRDPPLFHLAMIKREALNFSIEALAEGERGDLDAAAGAIENTAHMGNSLVTEPNAISQTVRLACYHIAINDAERLLSRHPLSISQMNKLTKLLKELPASGGLRLAVISERVRGLDALEELDQAPVLHVIKPMQSDRRIVLTVCDRLLSLGEADKIEILQQYDTIEVNRTNALAKTNAMFSDELSWSMLQGVRSSAYKFAIFEAHRRAAITALAVEHYRIEHEGKLPQRLIDITPQYLKEIPLDPLDGKPLRLKQLSIGFVVGSSGIDEGDYKRPFPYKAFTIER